MRRELVFFLVVTAIVMLPGLALAQVDMHHVVYNFRYFTADKKSVTPELETLTADSLKHHPEYGIMPYNASCRNCSELLQKRTESSRYFVVNGTKGKEFYVQQSYAPLHRKDQLGRWITIDPHLRPDASNPGLYKAENQAVQTFYDDADKGAGLVIDGVEFRHNRHLSMYYLDGDNRKQAMGNISRNTTMIGDDGTYTVNAWPFVDMEQVFLPGAVETNFLIQHQPTLPAGDGWLVFEDHFTLPPGCKFVRDLEHGKELENGNWCGGYKLVNSRGRKIAAVHRPKYLDDNMMAMAGQFQMNTVGDTVVLSMLVPAWWLKAPETKYPVNIDPYVQGFDSLGFYFDSSRPAVLGAHLAFSNSALGCPYNLIDTIPGKCTLVDAYIELEYVNSDSICGGGLVHPSCQWTDVWQSVSGPCRPIDTLRCRLDSTGRCTTDSVDVHIIGGGKPRPIYISAASDFVNCVPPQCAPYILTFTLFNHSTKCPDSCAYNCAIGTYFAVWVRGRTIEDTATVNKITVCANNPVKLTSFPTWGVPVNGRYSHYTWVRISDTIADGYGDSIVYDYPAYDPNPITYQCTAYDTCGDYAFGFAYVYTIQAPTIDAVKDQTICKGGFVALGGNPTGPAGDTIVWTGASPAHAFAWLSPLSSPNPIFAPPADSIGRDTFYLRVSDTLCSSFDTVFVTVKDNPKATLQPDPLKICPGGSVALSTTVPYSTYQWSNGETTPSIDVTTIGSFSTTITDSSGCKGVSDTVTSVPGPSPTATLQPNPPKFCLGDSVMLSTIATYASYQWSNGATTPSIAISTLGNFSVNIRDSAGCKGISDTVASVVVNPLAFTLSATPDTMINIGDNTTLSASIDLLGSNVQSYVWSPQTDISCNNCAQPQVSPKVRQEYYLDVVSSDGCPSRDSILIVVNYPNRYWIATAFTPNGDGLNDGFYIRKESGVTVNDFRVFDRWGQLVHEGPRPWLGDFNGSDKCPIGVYTYYFSLQFTDGTKKTAKGNVTLIR